MVCSAHPAAAFIGLSILQRGGNAFDAAIAVAAAEGVVLPMKCGLGGDAFVVLHDAQKHETVAFNGSGVAAAGATADYYRSQGHKSTADDFAQQEAVIYTPISTEYRGTTVYETAPHSQGFLVLEQLNIIEGFDLSKLAPYSPERMHLLIEAKKLAFADRNRYAGDPAFVKWPLQTLISKEHAALRRAEIDPGRARWPDDALLP